MYDSFLELPDDKRPPDDIWDKPEEVKEWLDKVFKNDKKQTKQEFITINLDEVEG